MRRIIIGLVVAVTIWTPAATRAASGDQGLIVNESGYLRRYCRFGVSRYSPGALRAEGEKVLGKAGLARLQRETEKALAKDGRAGVDWREGVFQPTFESFRPVSAAMPAANWASAEFDDAAWVLDQGPFQWASPADITNPALGQFEESSMDMGLQQAFYRVRFVVDDPARVGAVSFSMVYSGGARALVNGQEITRGHLPTGELSPEAAGQDYPAAAYKAGGEKLRERTIGPVEIPALLLRKGVNVLAMEIRASLFHPVVLTNPRQVNWGGPTRPFPHARLLRFELRSNGSGIVPALRRPAGVQVWVADMHQRVQSTDFLPPGESAGTIRLIGARNGTYAAQIVVGSDKQLTHVEVTSVAVEEAMPAVSHLAAYPVDEWTMSKLGDERGLGASFPTAQAMASEASMADAKKVYIFDHLTPEPWATVPANSCRPIWISVRVPADAPPGLHRGSVILSGAGMERARVPIELEVVDWRLPDPQQFQIWVGCEQNPYAVAKRYGVKLWSEEHFKLLEASFRQLARVGNTWLNVPVIQNTEFGNKDDSMIRWVRTADKRWDFDYRVLDRYLDLAEKHWGAARQEPRPPSPRMVQFVVMQGMKSQTIPPTPARVKVYDEAMGREVAMDIPAGQREAWRAFATSIYQHMQQRGWDKRMWWGAPLEAEADPELKNVLAAAVPQVHWTAGPHEMMSNGTYAKNDKVYTAITTIRYWPGKWPGFRDDQGWKSRVIHLLNPRVGGTVFALHTTSLPFAYRMLPQRAVSLGRSGFTRVGADEWDGVHYDGLVLPKWLTGMPVLFTLWPGAAGAESSVRFEAMLEGIQETEARIFLEQALDRGRLDAAMATRVKQLLADNSQETTFFLGNSIVRALEAYHWHWQERSAKLYRAAAEVAAKEKASR